MTELFDEPRCDKCGAPITTGLMAAFCPARKDCEFYVEGIEQFMEVFKTGDLGSSVEHGGAAQGSAEGGV